MDRGQSHQLHLVAPNWDVWSQFITADGGLSRADEEKSLFGQGADV